MPLPAFITELQKQGYHLEETHIDCVLVGPKFAYKIKKPVKFSFVDYSTLAKRKHFCHEELRLNRRYSPSIYFGVVPIEQDGKIVDCAVKMKSFLPEERLDRLLLKNKVSPKMIGEIARMLAAFHLRAQKISGQSFYPNLKKTLADNLNNISDYVGKSISRGDFNDLSAFLKNFPEKNRPFFVRRIKEGKIKDLHGDLHAENIFYRKKPYILDCIEFNSRFRQIDTAQELAFILMSFELLGKKELSFNLLKIYLERTKDYSALPLLNYYKCHYAAVRGMVNSMEGNFFVARRYFSLAKKYMEKKPLFLSMTGLIGTGKSTLAIALAGKLGLKILRSDELRKKLAKVSPSTHLAPAFYSKNFTNKTYGKMFSLAKDSLGEGRGVILDASFSKEEERKKTLQLAQDFNLDPLFIETSLPEKIILRRLSKRKKDVSDAGPGLLKSFSEAYDKTSDIPGENLVRVVGSSKIGLKKILENEKLLSRL